MDIHSKLQSLDFVIIVGYIVTLVAIGMWVSFRRRGAEDLFLGGRSQGWLVVGLSIFGTNVNPSFMISSCSVAYSSGFAAANFEWLAWWLMMLLAMLFIPYYMKTRVSTMPEFINRRFGPGAHRFLSYYALFTTIVSWLGLVLYTGGLLFSQIMDWPLWVSLVVLMAIATSFTVIGGLAAVMITDAFQTILMIGGAAALTIIGLNEVGGVSALIDKVPASTWQLFRSGDQAEYPWYAMLLGYPVAGIWFWCADQTIVQRVLGAKDMRHAQLGTVFAAFLKILPPFLFLLPGILCLVLHPGLEDPDEAFATMIVNHLPTGMIGLMVAVLIAALISTIDSGLNSFSTVFTLDIYKKSIRPQASASETKMVGRVATIVAALIAIGSALVMDRFDRGLFDMIQSVIGFIAPPVSAVFVIGVLWPRATSKAALTTLTVGSVVSISIGFCHLNDWPSKAFWPHFMLLSFYIFAGICALMVVVSLMTRNSPHEEQLPSLKQTYAEQGSRSRPMWLLWAILAAIMCAIYLFFD
ncbi:MAG: sodium/solute symporter [Phycisphaeraceae bacterium]|nr:sodium/solute symporter [Phycisphaeraceae bacterium]